MPVWTEEQKQAISLEGKNIIVSAGAGSGPELRRLHQRPVPVLRGRDQRP